METIGRIYKTQKTDASSSEQTNSTAIPPNLFGLSTQVLLLIHPPLFSSTMSLRVGEPSRPINVIMRLGRWAKERGEESRWWDERVKTTRQHSAT